ncbi:oxidoreductase [Pseudosporangium ferrugineum]|uniref:Short-subunit dehydrogenase n=1 Tax=Pseudosporangium ferrugineum TaxID=439699 RepID=A0A2T0SAR1_9ACTN|nr:oxidoreductase [Pseudosporangium ferrugineum]PRY30514.1 short-subunit dehydrogenase [Pseudosporangium ferrugineum]
MRTWFITGATRGLGREISLAALRRGDAVVLTGRDPAALDAVVESAGAAGAALTVGLDVTDDDAVRAAVAAALDRFGHLDVVVNNAGWGLMGAIEEVSDAECRAVFETNVFGLLAVTRAVLPHLRARRWGRVINIGSVGGFTQSAGMGVYGATKFAVEAITEALHAELSGLGIHSTVVEPGAIRTDFLDPSSLRHSERRIPDYDATAGARREWAEKINGSQPIDPVRAAEAIVALADEDVPPLRVQLGADAIARVEAKLDLVRRELTAWREVGLSVDRPALEQ